MKSPISILKLVCCLAMPAGAAAVFTANDWQLTIAEQNGAWISLKYQGEELIHNPQGEQSLFLNAGAAKIPTSFTDQSFGEAAGTASALLADTGTENELPLQLVNTHFDASRQLLTIRLQSGSWGVTETVQFGANGRPHRLRRNASFQSNADQDLKFRNLRYSLKLPLAGDYFFPATFFTDLSWREDNRPDYPTLDLKRRKGKVANLLNTGNDRIKFAIIEQRPGLSLLFFSDSRLDGANARFSRQADHLLADWRFSAQGWALPGEKQELAGAYLEVANKNADSTLRENCPQLLRDLGFIAPADRPDWIPDTIIYGMETEPFRQHRFADIATHVIPRMRQLGVNTTWYRPAEASTGRYCPIDYNVIEPRIGTWDDYRAVNAALHQLGMRAMQDLVPHGFGQLGFLLRGQSARMMSITEHGNILSGWGADFNNPDWRDYMESVTAFYTDNLKVDGFRIDAPYGSKCYNWRKKGFPDSPPGIVHPGNFNAKPSGSILPAFWAQTMKLDNGQMPPLEYPRASLASSHGGLNMVAAMRRGSKRGNPDSAILLESGELPFTAAGDMHYDRDIQSCWFKLRTLTPEEFVTGLTLWLDEQQYVDAPDAIRMRYMETGVGESWPYRTWFGTEGDKAIRTMNFVIHGVPMVFDTFTEGIGTHIARLAEIRQAIAPLRRGDANYRAASINDPRIFSVLRNCADESALALINFAPSAVHATLSLPPEQIMAPADAPLQLWNAFSGRLLASGPRAALATCDLTLKPFGCAVLVWRNADAPRPAWAAPLPPTPSKSTPALSSPTVDKSPTRWRVTSNSYILDIDPANGLIRSFRHRDATADLLQADILTTVDHAPTQPCTLSSRTLADGMVEISASASDGSQLLYRALPDAVQLSFRNPAMRQTLLSFPAATRWELDSCEGMLADVLPDVPTPRPGKFGRHHGKQRLLYDPSLLWAASERPLDWNRPEFRALGEHGVTIHFERISNEAYLRQELNQQTGLHFIASYGGNHGELHMTIKPAATPAKSVFAQPVSIGNGLTLTNESYGWRIENAHYRLHILRHNGVIKAFHAKTPHGEELLLGRQNLSADRAMFRNMPYACASMDPETQVTLNHENGVLTMRFWGELRSAYAISNDIMRVITEYRFDDSAEFSKTIHFQSLSGSTATPKLIYSAEQQPAATLLSIATAPAANSGHIADLSDGNALTLAFFDGFPGPLTPRAGYAFRLAFRGDGQPCRELNAPQPMSAAPGQADPTFDLRATRQSLKSGNVLPWTQPEVNDQLLWTSVNAVGIDQTAGCNNSPGVWMGWPNPVFTQSIPCEHLQANKTYRLAFQLRSNLSNDPTIKAWSDKLLTVHPHLRHATPFTATLDYFDNTGNKKSIRNEWSLPKQHDWTSFDMTITVPEDAFAPSLRFEATPEYAGEIFLDDITFDPIE